MRKKYERMSHFFNDRFTYIGSGKPGGKASGLAFIDKMLKENFPNSDFKDITINIPAMSVILTDVYDRFIRDNNLYDLLERDLSDTEIGLAFQEADFPVTVLGDLKDLISNMKKPLAIRSSSLLEDSINEPFAGVYETKMIPNNEVDINKRFRKLIEAVKFVYASVFKKKSRDYFKAARKNIRQEKMAVIIQEIVGEKYDDLFYPAISGVAKSYNFYPIGDNKPEDGIVSLALGLGRTIVNGEKSWSYSPVYPQAPPPFNSLTDLLKMTQTQFWAVDLENAGKYDPVKETEFLTKRSILRAEDDRTIDYLCSTYSNESRRTYTGLTGKGPRILDFSPILKTEIFPISELINKLLKLSENELGAEVEIEFAVTIKDGRARLGFLQIRPILISQQIVDIEEEKISEDDIFAMSDNVMGNGVIENIRDIVFVKPEAFKSKSSQQIAEEVGDFNNSLLKDDLNYMLIGFGRWGTSDEWLGIPVNWSQISAAKVVMELTLPSINPDLSQGAHFFHNMTSFEVLYFSIKSFKNNIDWDWLIKQEVINETKFLKHVKLKQALKIMVDGRKSKGVILK